MRIGVMTLWQTAANYGQVLQCYALQKYLRNSGHDAYIIRYTGGKDYLPIPFLRKAFEFLHPIKMYRLLLRTKNKATRIKENKERNFNDFRSKHIKSSDRVYRRYIDLKNDPPEADVYIVGSDQVWNTDKILTAQGKHPRAYFLDFGDPKIARISYAASICEDRWSKGLVKLIAPLLQKFSYVSVREQSALNICKQCGIDSAEWVPDPTVLLDADDYRMLYRNETLRKPDKPYIFLYYCGNMKSNCDIEIKPVYDYAAKLNLDVIFVGAHLYAGSSQKQTYATIPEWIYLLEHAQYVVTNSFHCAMLSVIFSKKFGIISKHRKSTHSRFDSLFELFGIEKRFLIPDFSILDKDIDWESVSPKLKFLQENCKLLNVIDATPAKQ